MRPVLFDSRSELCTCTSMSKPSTQSLNLCPAEEGSAILNSYCVIKAHKYLSCHRVSSVLPAAAEVAVKKPQKVTVWPVFTEADINAEKWVEYQNKCLTILLYRFCCRIRPVKESKKAKPLYVIM